MNWLTSTILVLWVAKCLVELLLLYVAIVRRIRVVWALALYSFTTTLVLMLLAGVECRCYARADQIVSTVGTGVAVVIAAGLLRLLWHRRREYKAVALVYGCLLGSEVALAFWRAWHGCTMPVNLLGMISWPIGVLALAAAAWSIPRPVAVSWRTIAQFMRDDLLE